MDDAVATLEQLLDQERSAALHADVDALTELQESKRRLLERLTQANADDERMSSLRLKAAANVQLIRQLVTCLSGILMPNGITYTVSGRQPASTFGRSRGHL